MFLNKILPIITSLYVRKPVISFDIEKGSNCITSISHMLTSIVISNDDLTEIIIEK